MTKRRLRRARRARKITAAAARAARVRQVATVQGVARRSRAARSGRSSLARSGAVGPATASTVQRPCALLGASFLVWAIGLKHTPASLDRCGRGQAGHRRRRKTSRGRREQARQLRRREVHVAATASTTCARGVRRGLHLNESGDVKAVAQAERAHAGSPSSHPSRTRPSTRGPRDYRSPESRG